MVDDGDGPYRERFLKGSTARSIRERAHKIRLMVGHDTRRLPIGTTVEMVEADDGLHAAFRISETADGNDALTLIRDGIVDSFSIGFIPLRSQRASDGVIERLEVSIREVSLVFQGAYPGAKLAGVRAAQQQSLSVDAARVRMLQWGK
nr:HK97 family phage prohead protease [Rhodococcus pyridinivorans]